MLPNEIFPGFDLYTLMLCVAVVAAILVYRYFADKKRLGSKLQNLCLVTAALAILGGYYSAVLFQAFYNIKKNGGFVINASTGATFYGGLIGGAAIFLLVYFAVGGRIFKKTREHVASFWSIADIASASIVIAHSAGRIGCLFAGCCHGKVTDAWYGIYMVAIGKKVVPVQLFEAIFLALLFLFFVYRLKNNKTYNLPIYMGAYGIWRFLAEYLRADYRGSTFTELFTPSQFTAIVMVAAAAILFLVQMKTGKKTAETLENEGKSDDYISEDDTIDEVMIEDDED